VRQVLALRLLERNARRAQEPGHAASVVHRGAGQ
jgi:hypothetical protein